MIALYIILGIILFIILILCIPVSVNIRFKEEFFLTIGYLFFRIPVMPGKEKTEEELAKEKEEKEKKKQEKKEKKEKGEKEENKLKQILKRTGFKGFLESLFDIVKLALNAGKNIVKKIKLKKFDLYLCIGGANDAAEAAVMYGRLSAMVYAACTTLFELTRCRKKAVTIDVNYDLPENLVDFSAKLTIVPITVVKEGLALLIRSFPSLKKLLGLGRSNTQRKKVRQ